MVSASLVRDKENNLKATGMRRVGKTMEYEFTFPHRNASLGNTLWEAGKAYQIAILVGPSEEFKGITQDTWMSDQLYIRLGSASKESIYHPPYLVQREKAELHGH